MDFETDAIDNSYQSDSELNLEFSDGNGNNIATNEYTNINGGSKSETYYDNIEKDFINIFNKARESRLLAVENYNKLNNLYGGRSIKKNASKSSINKDYSKQNKVKDPSKPKKPLNPTLKMNLAVAKILRNSDEIKQIGVTKWTTIVKLAAVVVKHIKSTNPNVSLDDIDVQVKHHLKNLSKYLDELNNLSGGWTLF